MRDDRLLFVLLALYLLVIAALLIKDSPIAKENKAAVTQQDSAPPAKPDNPSVAKQDNAEQRDPPADTGGTRGLTANCEKELRRSADLLRLFANRIQMGEDTQTVVADMRQQEKNISSVCD